MPIFFAQPVVAPKSVTIKTSSNTLVLSTTNTHSTLHTDSLNLDVNELLVQGGTGGVGQVVMHGLTGPYWGDVQGVTGPTGPIGATGPTGPTGPVLSGAVSTITSLSNLTNVSGPTGFVVGNFGVNLGTPGFTTNLRGNVYVKGSAGTSGQCLVSDGTSALWGAVPASSLSSVLTVGANANNRSITNLNSIDSSGTSLSIGAGINTPQVSIGSFNRTVNIAGNLQLNNSAGTSGQVLTSNGTSAAWQSPSAGSASSLASVLAAGADANNTSITNLPFVDASGTLALGTRAATTQVNLGSVNKPVNILGNLQINNNSGTSGQVLTSNGTSAAWQSPSAGSASSLASVLAVGADANNNSITNLPFVDASGTLALGTRAATTQVNIGSFGVPVNIVGNLQLSGSAGTSGQVLTSNGTSAAWQSPSAGSASSLASVLAVGADANNTSISNLPFVDASGTLALGTRAATNQVNLGSAGVPVNIVGNLQLSGSAGTSGQVLTSNGTSAAWQSPIAGSASSLASVLAAGADANNTSITNLPFVDASGILGLGRGSSTSEIGIGRPETTTIIHGNLIINRTLGDAGYQYCSVDKNNILMLDVCGNQHDVNWGEANLFKITPNETAQLVNKWQSYENGHKINLCGYLSSFVVTEDSGDVIQPDHSTMNNNYVLWLKFTVLQQVG